MVFNGNSVVCCDDHTLHTSLPCLVIKNRNEQECFNQVCTRGRVQVQSVPNCLTHNQYTYFLTSHRICFTCKPAYNHWHIDLLSSTLCVFLLQSDLYSVSALKVFIYLNWLPARATNSILSRYLRLAGRFGDGFITFNGWELNSTLPFHFLCR